eukprot:1157630-Pelagomonas_calceolata.AAC.3
MPACPARFGSPTHPFSDTTISALATRGMSRLFSHQAAAVDAVLGGAHVAVSTSTASGKVV